MQELQDLANAGKDCSIELSQRQWELAEIFRGKPVPALLGVVDAVELEQVAGNREVRATRGLDVFRRLRHSERCLERTFHSPLAGSASQQKCSIDIKENDVHAIDLWG